MKQPQAKLPRLFGFLLLAALLTTSAGLAADEGALVQVDTVRSERLAETAPIIGRLVAQRAGVVAARVPGAVAEMRVEVGVRVARGDVVATLIADRYAAERDLRAAEVVAAQAAVASAQAALQLRLQELARIDGLRRSPAFSEARYQDKRQEVSVAAAQAKEMEAALVRARAQLRLAEIALSEIEVRAPYAGVVTKRHTELGAALNAGDPVISLIEDRNPEIEVDVPADRLGGLAGTTRLRVDIGEVQTTASVRAVIPEENPLTRTRTVRLVPDLSRVSDVAANRSVTIHVQSIAPRTAVTVHKDAVLHGAAGPYVVRVVDGRAEYRPVRLGQAAGIRFEVVEGLVPGDIVVVRGNERLQPGDAVRSKAGDLG